MKRIVAITALAIAGASIPAAAQVNGLPLFNNPMGTNGVAFGGLAGFPDEDFGSGATAAGYLGLGNGMLSATLLGGVRSPGEDRDSFGVFGANAALRLLGGNGIPVNLNLQGGVGIETNNEVPLLPNNIGDRSTRNYTGSVGLGLNLGTERYGVQPWVSGGVRMVDFDVEGLQNSTNFGFSAGADVLLPAGFMLRGAVDFTQVDFSLEDPAFDDIDIPTSSEDVAVFAFGFGWNFHMPSMGSSGETSRR